MRKGLADIKLVLLGALPIIVGGMSGSFTAIYLAQRLGEQSDGIIRLLLGLMLLFIAAVFVFKSSASDYPVRKKSERFSQFLKLRKTYWESSLGSYISYRATNVKLSIFLFLVIGFTGGFFGLGGGWAAVPLLNLVMSIPIKVATGTSGVLLRWEMRRRSGPINVGALIGIIAAPWMLGQVIGGLIGASLLTFLKASTVRALLIVILFGSSLKLVVRGIETLTGIEIPLL